MAINFPTQQWTRIRKATYVCLAIRKRFPKGSGENKEAWYNRIRPKVVDELKKKSLPYTAPERFEFVADYLSKFPKFCSHMEAKEATQRPGGKRKAQDEARVSSIRQRLESEAGMPSGNRSVLDGGPATQHGIAAMSSMLNSVYAQSQQMLVTVLHAQQVSAHQQTRALVMALRPEQLAAFDAAQPAPLSLPLPPPAPAPAPMALGTHAAQANEANGSVTVVNSHQNEANKNNGNDNDDSEVDE